MPIDIDQVSPPDRQLIQAYGDNGFKISGLDYTGSVIVFPTETVDWDADSPESISVDTLGPVVHAAESTDLLIVGCGPTFAAVPAGLRDGLKERGISLEWMDTGAACRTFNVLVGEERRVAAALISVD